MKLWDSIKSNRVLLLLIETNNKFGEDKGGLLAAAVAYYLLFSIFPFALAMISIAGFFMESASFETGVINAMGNLLPVAKGMMEKNPAAQTTTPKIEHTKKPFLDTSQCKRLLDILDKQNNSQLYA